MKRDNKMNNNSVNKKLCHVDNYCGEERVIKCFARKRGRLRNDDDDGVQRIL